MGTTHKKLTQAIARNAIVTIPHPIEGRKAAKLLSFKEGSHTQVLIQEIDDPADQIYTGSNGVQYFIRGIKEPDEYPVHKDELIIT